MVKKCIYCKGEISDESVIDVCEKCGRSVWGEKMFNTIVRNMQTARENGDLCNDNFIRNSSRETEDFRGFR